MHLFGVNEFAARLPNAVGGLVTLLLVYRIGLRLHDRMFGWLWVLSWLGSFLPHFYFRSGMIDPWFNLFVFGGLYGFIEFRWQFLTRQNHSSYWNKYRYLLAGGVLSGLAIMMKGPVAYLIVMLVPGLYWFRYRFTGRGYLKHLVLFSAAAWLIAFAWLGFEIALNGWDFAQKFVGYQLGLFATPKVGNAGFFVYPVVMLLVGSFPVSVFALPNLWGDHQSQDEMLESDTLAACQRSDLTTWMQLLFWTVFFLFGIFQVNNTNFSSLCYFPITYLGAVTIWRAVRWDVRPKLISYFLLAVGLVFGLGVMIIPWLGQHTAYLREIFASDIFTLHALDAEVGWHTWQGIPGLVFIIATLAGYYFWRKNRPWLTAQTVFIGGAVFTKLTMLFIVCNIEGHSQRAAIEFYKSKCGESCDIQPVGFKTYAHLFYACKQPDVEVDKTFIVAKVNNMEDLTLSSEVRELYRKNGFVFFEKVVSESGK